MQSQPDNSQNPNQTLSSNPTIINKTNEPPTNSQNTLKGSNKRWITIGAAIFIIVMAVSSILFLSSRKNNASNITNEEPTPFLPEADPRIKVELAPYDPGKTVLLKVSNLPKDITSLEYELTYKTDSKSEGVFGLIKLDSESDSVEREITLGTCSSGVCKYHNVTSKGQLTIKFNSSKGASRFQKEFDLL